MDISPNSDNQTVVKYTTYPDLLNDSSALDEAFFTDITKNKESLDWKQSFDYLDQLRKYNKYNSEEFILTLPKFLPFILFNINNLRSNLIKNSLILVKEVFAHNQLFFPLILHKQPGIIMDLIPIIYEKANNDKVFLKNEAKEAISSLEKNCPLNEIVLKILANLAQEKNPGISEKAALSLSMIVSSNQEEIIKNQIPKELFIFVIKIMGKLLDSNRMSIRKNGEEILAVLSQNQSFEELLDSSLDKKEKDLVLRIMEEKKKGSAKNKESLKDFLSKKKQEK